MKKNFTLIIFLLITLTGFSQTWNGNVSTDWSNANNWTPSGSPAAVGSNITIPGALSRYPVLTANVTLNSIDMQAGSQLDVNGFTLSFSGTNMYIYFIGATLNNSNAASDIVLNINTGVGGWATYFRSNTVNDHIIFNLTGSNPFFEGDGAPVNHFNGNTSVNINDVLPVYISYISPSEYNGNLTVNRTVAGGTNLFNAGGNITGNYAFTNNTGSGTSMGNSSVKTSIGGTVNITANYTSPGLFEMHRLINQTSGGVINVQNSQGFYVERDTLKLSSLSITGYRASAYGYFFNNSISGNVTLADDASYTGGYVTYIRSNEITGNSTFTNNGTNTLFDADQGGSENHYIGNVTFNGAGTGLLYISHGAASQYNGNLTINRTVPSQTQAFNSGAAISGNFTYTNNTTGNTYFGNPATKTSIGGTINISANYTSPALFEMHRLINQTTGGIINVQNSQGFYVQRDTLKLSLLSITGYTGSAYGYFLNNSITGNVTTADNASYTGGYATYLRSNVLTGNSSFSNNGTNAFFDADNAGDANTYNGNVTYNGAGGPLYIAHGAPLLCTGNLILNRTVAGITYIFYSGGTVNGNFSYTNNTAGNSYLGNTSVKTSIGGAVNITANYTTPDLFEMYRLVNQTNGGSIVVQNSAGFNVQSDTLKVTTFSITGYRGNAYAFFLNNSITGNVTTADDASYSGGYASFFRKNTITGNTSIANNGTNTLHDPDGGGDGSKYIGNVTYTRTGGPINVGTGGAAPMEITQNLTLNSAGGVTLGQIKFNGSTDGIIEQLGTQDISISQLTMEKTGGGKVILNDPLTVSNALTFNTGIILSSTTNNLVFPDNAICTGASDVSYVEGTVRKIGNDAFTFPMGKANEYAPISITAPTDISDAFKAQYTRNVPHTSGYDSTLKDASLHHISAREYWVLDRTAGTSNVKVTLSWDRARSGNVNSMPDLRVARWNGSLWKDEGNGGTTGNNDEGSIQSLNAVSSFSPFTLASANQLNPLPVKLTGFNVVKVSNAVKITWSTTNETTFDHFEIEKNINGTAFIALQSVKAKGGNNNNDYEVRDNAPVPGKNYYRLKMIDIDGQFTYSKVVAIDFSANGFASVYPNPAGKTIKIYTDQVLTGIEIIDMNGRVLKNLNLSADSQYNISDLRRGIYFLKLKSTGQTAVIRFSKL